mmetsp:Transcript_17111/g.26504  ORF Transcript_17111/g.26504 Transcript_17111/m.26504 type:complete len:502 (-) Transcript_17111:98-1603(-)
MGGGDGAKERRRLKRLQKESGEQPQDRNSPKNNSKFPAKPKARHFDGKRKEPFKKPNPPKVAKKKKLKPKHLKRKLEQADEADADTRKVVLSEIEEWERKKSIYLGTPNKRPKVETSSHQPFVSEPESSFLAHREMDFPREPVVPKPVTKTSESPKKVQAAKKKSEKARKALPEKNLTETTILDSKEPSSKKSQVQIEDRSPAENEPVRVVAAKSGAKKTKIEDDVDTGELSDGSAGSDDIETEQRRQRGRRRRGRKDTAKQIEESKESNGSGTEEIAGKDGKATKSLYEDASEAAAANEKSRYCIGRKPVTDFVIGQKYLARVVYVKPFGVFFDIGCHSDAFCHVSRLKDDFVENPEQLFKEGDQTEARVVEINRREKRITVSLQSESRLEDEMASIDARKKRLDIRRSKYNNKRPKRESPEDKPAPVEDTKNSSPAREDTKDGKSPRAPQSKPPSVPNSAGKPSEPRSIPKHESEMTPAELKRARKIARRATRRAQSED